MAMKKERTVRSKKALPQLERGARSKAVREYLAANPKESPQKVVAALKEQGIDISLGLVSVIKYSKPKSNRGNSGTTADVLLQTKRLVDSIGFDNARLALDVLEKLR